MSSADRRLWLAGGAGLALLALSLLLAAFMGGSAATTADGGALRIEHQGRLLGFGPFVGYRITVGEDPQEITFTCHNDDRFYTRDLGDGALLFRGQGRLVELPPGEVIPGGRRIEPLGYDEVPEAWLATRPEPQAEWRHFHSCYDDHGAVRSGYWLRHVAQDAFTYDMGGRVGPESVLHHEVQPGVDLDFAPLLEFDRGPDDASG